MVLFDEADCLSGATLISFLSQLRHGYVNRIRAPFPVSLALVGMRNIRDHKAKVRPDRETLGSASPFNIVTEALTLTNFTRKRSRRSTGSIRPKRGRFSRRRRLTARPIGPAASRGW